MRTEERRGKGEVWKGRLVEGKGERVENEGEGPK